MKFRDTRQKIRDWVYTKRH